MSITCLVSLEEVEVWNRVTSLIIITRDNSSLYGGGRILRVTMQDMMLQLSSSPEF